MLGLGLGLELELGLGLVIGSGLVLRLIEAHRCCPSVLCSFVCLSVCFFSRQNAYTETRFSQKLSNLQLLSLINSKTYIDGLSKNPLSDA